MTGIVVNPNKKMFIIEKNERFTDGQVAEI